MPITITNKRMVRPTPPAINQRLGPFCLLAGETDGAFATAVEAAGATVFTVPDDAGLLTACRGPLVAVLASLLAAGIEPVVVFTAGLATG